MNTLNQIERDLLLALAEDVAQHRSERVEFSLCRDRSLLTSCWQKSIRRGNAREAVSCALTLHEADPDYVFRRIRLIALEEVSVADLQLVGQVLAVAGKRVLRRLLDERALLTVLTMRLALATKCRTPCDLLIWTPTVPQHADAHVGEPELVAAELQKSGADVLLRTAMLWKSTAPSSVRTRAGWQVLSRGSASLRDRWLEAAGVPSIVSYIVKRGGSTDCLNSLLAPSWQLAQFGPHLVRALPGPSSSSEMIGGVPAYAYCVYSEPGRSALGHYLARDHKMRAELARHGAESALRTLGDLVFDTEGGYCDHTLKFSRADEIQLQATNATLARRGVPNGAVPSLREQVTDALPLLNASRRAVAQRINACSQIPLAYAR